MKIKIKVDFELDANIQGRPRRIALFVVIYL